MDTKFFIEGAQKNMSGSILCEAINDAGNLYETSDLTIYGRCIATNLIKVTSFYYFTAIILIGPF